MILCYVPFLKKIQIFLKKSIFFLLLVSGRLPTGEKESPGRVPHVPFLLLDRLDGDFAFSLRTFKSIFVYPNPGEEKRLLRRNIRKNHWPAITRISALRTFANRWMSLPRRRARKKCDEIILKCLLRIWVRVRDVFFVHFEKTL